MDPEHRRDPTPHGSAHDNGDSAPLARFASALPIIFTAISLVPFAIGVSGWIYLLCTIVLNAAFVFHVAKLADEQAPRVVRHSIAYLGLMFAAFLLDRYVHLG